MHMPKTPMKDKMFPFVTCQPNPIGGCASGNYWGDEGFRFCSFGCTYCWAKDLKTRFRYPKYQGSWRIIEKELVQFDADAFPWPCDMIDIGDPTIPKEVLLRFWKWVASQPCPVLTLTKNPATYRLYWKFIPENAVLGATIETDTSLTKNYSKAPEPYRRFLELMWVKDELPNEVFICIEPIMKFTPDFARELEKCRPWAIAVGYDNYSNKLNEPPLKVTEYLIKEAEYFTKVYVKDLRERWVG